MFTLSTIPRGLWRKQHLALSSPGCKAELAGAACRARIGSCSVLLLTPLSIVCTLSSAACWLCIFWTKPPREKFGCEAEMLISFALRILQSAFARMLFTLTLAREVLGAVLCVLFFYLDDKHFQSVAATSLEWKFTLFLAAFMPQVPLQRQSLLLYRDMVKLLWFLFLVLVLGMKKHMLEMVFVASSLYSTMQ